MCDLECIVECVVRGCGCESKKMCVCVEVVCGLFIECLHDKGDLGVVGHVVVVLEGCSVNFFLGVGDACGCGEGYGLKFFVVGCLMEFEVILCGFENVWKIDSEELVPFHGRGVDFGWCFDDA